ncbi:MAG: sigma 54-interacting transcriptional regulator [Fibrobacterota bacterium]
MPKILLATRNIHLFDSLLKENSIDTVINRIDTLEGALSMLDGGEYDSLVADIPSLEIREIDYINYIKQRYPDVEIITLTDIETIDAATRSIQSGALFYLVKPVSCKTIEQALSRIRESRRELRRSLKSEQQMMYDIIGESPKMERVIRLATKVAPSSATVLINGENGTGKEFLASIIHNKSNQKGRFIPVNCGAIPDNLFESELFGHRKGSFTGADRNRSGLAEEAEGGTLFLDEVGELSPANQVKLLRFLQEKSFKPVGANAEIRANLRIIAATNRDLRLMVREKTFREDLFYRLHVFPITLPPLRERMETLPNLIRTFVFRSGERQNKMFRGFTKRAEMILANHDYPGNIRELENIIEHAAIMAEGTIITEHDLPQYLTEHTANLIEKHPTQGLIGFDPSHSTATSHSPRDPERSDVRSLNEHTGQTLILGPEIEPMEEVEHRYISFALKKSDNNYSETARKLGISRSTLWRKLKEKEKES